MRCFMAQVSRSDTPPSRVHVGASNPIRPDIMNKRRLSHLHSAELELGPRLSCACPARLACTVAAARALQAVRWLVDRGASRKRHYSRYQRQHVTLIFFSCLFNYSCFICSSTAMEGVRSWRGQVPGAANALTPEFRAVLRFLKAHPNPYVWDSCVPQVSGGVERVCHPDLQLLEAALVRVVYCGRAGSHGTCEYWRRDAW